MRGVMDPRAMDTQRTSGSLDPVPVTTDIVVTNKFNQSLTLAAGTSNVSPSSLASVLPSCVDRFRLIKLSVYGLNTTSSVVTQIGLADLTSDLAQFSDVGTSGSVNPQIHILPSFEVRSQWFNSATTTNLYAITSPTTTGQVLLQFTAEVRTVP